MRSGFRFVLGLGLFTAAWTALPWALRAQDAAVTAFVNANVVPMTSDAVLRDHTVVVRGYRVVAVGPSGSVEVPAGARRVDAAGKYLLPGLAEMHGHTVGEEASAQAENDMMFLYTANGVTTVRGMLGSARQLPLRERANSGKLLGPTLYLAGPSFSGNSISSAEQAAARVRQQKQEGWDLLKVHPGLTREKYDAMANAASEAGIRFGGHVPADVGLLHAIEMGQETFDHLDGILEHMDAVDKPVDRDRLAAVVRILREADAAVVPTMALWEVGIIGLGDADELNALPELRYWPRDNEPGVPTANSWLRQLRERQPSDRPAAELLAQNRRTVLKALSDGGVTVLLGTDSPQIFSVPGFSIHREMAAMAAAGMSPFEILASGTRNVGAYFQREDSLGTVAVGKRADLLLLNSNPLEDVTRVADRAGVMVRGRWLPEAEIQAELRSIAQRFGNSTDAE
jgi:imidazolonepropionase-like amidohydrolase